MITIVGLVFIAAMISVLFLYSYFGSGTEPIPLPDIRQVTPPPTADVSEPDTKGHVEITRENIRAVISTLKRPDTYSREVLIETFWENGKAEYLIKTDVTNGVTSLHILQPSSLEKRIIVTPDTLYIWYEGDKIPYSGEIGSAGNAYRTADEWQMLVHYEELLVLDQNNIVEAGYEIVDGEDYIFVVCLSPLLGYTKKYYVSIDYGLVTGAGEYDETGALVYRMTTGKCLIGEIDPTSFILPDGSLLVPIGH